MDENIKAMREVRGGRGGRGEEGQRVDLGVEGVHLPLEE